MAKIAQNRPNEKKNIGFGQSGKKFCGHKNFGNFLKKILGMRTKFFRRNSGNTRRYLKSDPENLFGRRKSITSN